MVNLNQKGRKEMLTRPCRYSRLLSNILKSRKEGTMLFLLTLGFLISQVFMRIRKFRTFLSMQIPREFDAIGMDRKFMDLVYFE